jgi:hypothetical protein
MRELINITFEVSGVSSQGISILQLSNNEAVNKNGRVVLYPDYDQVDLLLSVFERVESDVKINCFNEYAKTAFVINLADAEIIDLSLVPQVFKTHDSSSSFFFLLRDTLVESAELSNQVVDSVKAVVDSEIRFLSDNVFKSLFGFDTLDFGGVDAFLLFLIEDAHRASLRLLLFGLSEIRNPSFHVFGGFSAEWGQFSEDCRIHFDKLESRWVVQSGSYVKRILRSQNIRIPTSLLATAAGANVFFIAKQ